MFVSTEVTLQNNKKEIVYYLDEEGKKVVRDAKATIYEAHSKIQSLFYRVETLESIIDTLKERLRPQIKEWLETAFLKFLTTMPTNRSFRANDFTSPFRRQMNLHWRFGDIISELFDEIVKDGGIEERGSGWYRNQVSVKEA